MLLFSPLSSKKFLLLGVVDVFVVVVVIVVSVVLDFVIKILLRYGVVDVFEPEDLMELRNIPKVKFPHCFKSSQYLGSQYHDHTR